MYHDPEKEYAAYSARNRRLIKFLIERGYLSTGSRILDVGSGSGHILRSIVEMVPGVDITCLEPSEKSSSFLRSQGFNVISSLEEASGTYQLVLLVEVVEHVDDPVHLLTSLKPRLAPDGVLFCTTPCGELRNGSRDTNAYDTPEHVGFFTEQSFLVALESAGFTRCTFTRVWQLYPYPSFLDFLKHELKGRIKDFWFGRGHLVCFAK